jgi:epoxyqueuosine reductase
MLNQIKTIMSQNNMPETGICRFSDIENSLISCRAKQQLPQTPKSIIVTLFPYYIGEILGSNISKYAWSRDYHKVCGEMLANVAYRLHDTWGDENSVPFIDNSPIPEVKAAQLAGLGVIGENGLLISHEYGSFVFIGSIVTTLELMPSNAGGECNHCGICVRACPTGAISENEKFNKELCLSYITQKKGKLTDFEKREITKSGCIWGCDICQNVCPRNIGIKKTFIKDFYENLYPIITENNINSIDLPQERAFFWRGKDIISQNLGIMK